ncbi:Imm63 family immunity protein [Pseudodesulfovibrio sp.]|uniref:Imm63 family immunity protein n=1 Tax=unclassified Pseudodesulfovibrio TaxID=2661612 RepID=UPI003B00FE07
MKSVNELQNEIIRLGKIIDAPESYLKIGDGFEVVCNVEIHDDEYHYVLVERGIERKRIISKSASDIMYLFVESASHGLASNYELENRIPGQDFRRLLFKKQLELLEKICPEWARKRQEELTEILESHPYDDK